MCMSNEMPKGATLAKSKEDLTNDEHLEKIQLQNKISREVLESRSNEKKLDDIEATLHNAKILNKLSKNLVNIFFSKFAFTCWIVSYALLNVCLYYYLAESASFYISLIDKIGLFIIVCILGKFLKDNLTSFIEMFKK